MAIFIGPKNLKMKRLLIIIFALLTVVTSTAQGNCSDEDLQYMAENNEFVLQLTQDCGTDCVFEADPEGCVVTCIQAQTPLSDDCALCFAEQVQCVVDNCFFDCLFGSADDCAACVTANCLDGFQVCAGIVDIDGDGFTVLTDCDDNNFDINPDATEIWYDGVDQNCDGLNDFDQDQDGDDSVDYGGTDCDDMNNATSNDASTFYADVDMDGWGDEANSIIACVQPPNTVINPGDCDDTRDDVYPGAPGTQEGIDNNCNGVLDPDEEFQCMGDFNQDNIINTTDLLTLLADMGCVGTCVADMDNNQTVTTTDLLLFLSVFGTFC